MTPYDAGDPEAPRSDAEDPTLHIVTLGPTTNIAAQSVLCGQAVVFTLATEHDGEASIGLTPADLPGFMRVLGEAFDDAARHRAEADRAKAALDDAEQRRAEADR